MPQFELLTRLSSRVSALPRAFERACFGRTCLATALLAAGTPTVHPLAAQVVSVLQIEVRDNTRGAPVPAASIEIAGRPTNFTDGRGRTVLRALPPGLHRVHVSAYGHVSQSVAVTVANGRTTYLEVSLEARPIELPALSVEASSPGEVGALTLELDDLDPGVRDLGDVLTRIPGAVIVRRGGPGSAVTLQLRGADSDQILVLLDGSPINSVSSGAADLSTLDLSALERVTVLQGSRSARYGPGALGGVVLLESRRHGGRSAEAQLSTGAWGANEVSLRGSAGLGPSLSGSGMARWSSSVGDFRYAVPAFRGGGEALRENGDAERRSGQLGLTFDQPARRFTLRTEFGSTRRGSPGTIAQPSLTGAQSHDRVAASSVVALGNQDRGVTARASIQSQRSEYRDASPPFGQSYDDRTVVLRTEIASDGRTTIGPLALRGGFEARRTRADASSLEPRTPTYREAGAWTQLALRIGLADLGEFEFTNSARMDRHELLQGAVFSPSFSASFTRSQFSLSLRYANGFAPPTVSDLFFQEGVLVRSNPDLRPERVRDEWSVSAAQSVRFSTAEVRAEASAWTADVEDMILWFPDFRFIWSPSNFFVTRRGVDGSITLSLPIARTQHTAAVRFGDSAVEYADGGLTGQVAYRPRRTISFDTRSAVGPVVVTSTFGRIGARRSVAGSELNTLPSYDRVDVGVSLPFEWRSRDLRLDVSGTNLLDESAALLVDYPLPGRGWAIRLHIS